MIPPRDEKREYESEPSYEDLFEDVQPTADSFRGPAHNYWAGRREKFPLLSLMAKDLLSIPATSAASERSFSVGRDAFGLPKNRLDPHTAEALVCLRSWLRAELIN